jgi:MFS family permease
MRGRVMALYSIAFLGTAPIGGPFVGWIAQTLGPSVGFFVAGAVCVVVSSSVPINRCMTNMVEVVGRCPQND